MRYAAYALMTSRRAGNLVSVARAHLLLVRIMATANRLAAARTHLRRADDELHRLRNVAEVARPLQALRQWANGVLLLHSGQDSARDELTDACAALAKLGDHSSAESIRQLLLLDSGRAVSGSQ
jgi:hypothetical protein